MSSGIFVKGGTNEENLVVDDTFPLGSSAVICCCYCCTFLLLQ